MTISEGITFIIVTLVICVCVVLIRKTRKLQTIIDALNTTSDFSEAKIKELGTKYYSLTKEISRTRTRADLFSKLVGKIGLAIWQRNTTSKITYTNDTYMQVIGEDENRPANKIVELYKGEEKLAQQVYKSQKPETIRKHIISGGQRKYFEITEAPLEDGTFGFAYDLNEVENLKDKLEESEILQDKILECATSAITIYSSDKRLTYYNQVFINLWQLDEAFLDSNPTYGEILEKLREQGKLPEHADFKSFKRSQLAMFTDLLEKNEEIYYLPDGRTLRSIFIPAQEGGLLISYKDITDQISLERSYNTLISVRAQTLDNLSEAIAVFGSDGKLQVYNPVYAKLWKLTKRFLDKSPHINDILLKTGKLYNAGDGDKFETTILSLINKRTHSSERLQLNDGTTLLWSSTPLPDGALLLTYTDITASTKVEESLRSEQQALRESETIKNNFLANVSYKLRSPLTSISGFSEMLTAGYFGSLNDKQSEYVNGIISSSNQLSALVDNILDITSIDAGQMALDVKEFDIYQLLQEIPDSVKKYIHEHKVKINIKCAKNIGSMSGDRKRIIQTINNMVRNSMRFIGNNGNITIEAKSLKNGNITISVADDGRGIPPDELEHIFDRFNKQTSYGAGETGLGLTVAKSFVELHEGTIQVDSELGKGTKITCEFKRDSKKLPAKVSI